MRVLVDGRCLQGNARGMGVYTASLLRALARCSPGSRPAITVALDRSLPDPSAGVPGEWPLLRTGGWGGQILWEQWHVPRAAAAGRFELLHAPANGAPLRCRIPVVVTIHDTIFVRKFRDISAVPYPRQFLGHLYRVRVYPAAARRATAVITVSEASRRDVISVLKVPASRVTVTREALPEGFSIARTAPLEPLRKLFSLPGPYLLAMGAYEKRKNIPLLFRALLQVARSGVKLALAGAENLAASGYPDTVRAMGLSDRVVFLPYLSDADFKALYNGATAFCWPSLREGFGLPLLEAMSCGTPILASRIPVNEEIAGPAAEYLDPSDAAAWAAAIGRAVSEEGWRRDLAAKGRARVSTFSWDRTAEGTLAVWTGAAGPESGER